MSTNNPNIPSSASNLKHPPPSSSSSSQHASSSSSSSKPAGSTPSAHHHHQLTAEERLQKEWRTITSNLLQCFARAEKAGKETTKDNCKELDESVVNYLKMRMMWHRLMSHVQAKIQGKEEEMAALENYVRTQPKLGLVGKKRKRQEEAPNIFDATAAAAAAATATPSGSAAVGGSSTTTATPPTAAAAPPPQAAGVAPPPGGVNP